MHNMKRFLTAAVCLLMVGCATARPPRPPFHTFDKTVRVFDAATGGALAGVSVISNRGTAITDTLGGTRLFSLPGRSEVCAELASYLRLCGWAEDTPDELTLRLVKVIPPLQKLHADGPVFRTEDGQPWRWKLVSMFTAARRFTQGEDLSAQVNWTKAVGGNGWRVFLQHAFMDWDPSAGVFEKHWVTPLDKIRPLAEYLARNGLYVEFTILADCQEFGEDGGNHYPALNQSFTQQRDRVREVLAAVGDLPNVIIEIANEPPFNGVDPWRIVDALDLAARRPMLMAAGDYRIIGNEANFRVLDFIGDHPDRDGDWPSEAPKTQNFINKGWAPDEHSPGFSGRNVPVPADEPFKFGEVQWDNGDRAETSLDNAEDAGAGFGVGAAGATCHTVDGIRSKVPGPLQTAACTRYFSAMDWFPVDAITGQYTHDTWSTHPLEPTTQAGEVAGRNLRGRSYTVATQPTAAWRAVPKAGCEVLRTGGSRNNLLELACR